MPETAPTKIDQRSPIHSNRANHQLYLTDIGFRIKMSLPNLSCVPNVSIL
jgi:hypothetical protein